jgi:hypothetical protein
MVDPKSPNPAPLDSLRRVSGDGRWRTGAVAVLDALGFKGIWENHDPGMVLAKLQRLATLRREWEQPRFDDVAPDEDYGAPIIVDRWIRLFSDTLVIAVDHWLHPDPTKGWAGVPTGHQSLLNYFSVVGVCFAVQDAIESAAIDGDPPLTYRGCIACGHFEVRNEFMVGPAIDAAAEAEHLADGAFVWLLPSAVDALLSLKPGVGGEVTVADYDVPMKGAVHHHRTHVVNPLLGAKAPDLMGERILSSFDRTNTAEVRLKRQNTEAFLSRARVSAA